MGGKLFAVDLRQVREVFVRQSYTPVPGMPAQLVGVANLRGTIVPLADLRMSFGISRPPMPGYVLVVRHGPRQVGLLIDDVPEIRTIFPDDVLDQPAPGTTDRHPLLSGLVKVEGRISPMLEASELMAFIEESTAEARSQDHRKPEQTG